MRSQVGVSEVFLWVGDNAGEWQRWVGFEATCAFGCDSFKPPVADLPLVFSCDFHWSDDRPGSQSCYSTVCGV